MSSVGDINPAFAPMKVVTFPFSSTSSHGVVAGVGHVENMAGLRLGRWRASPAIRY